MKPKTEEKQFLCKAGEYSVCAELQKRNINASVTAGAMLPGDIIIYHDLKIWMVEVKTTKSAKIVTAFFQKYYDPERINKPAFWVLVHIHPETLISDYYVLTHEEMTKEQMIRNGMTEWKAVKRGVDNILVSN